MDITSNRRSSRSAFTLLEIVIVIGLIAVLATLTIGNLSGLFENSRKDIAKQFVTQALRAPLTTYQIHMGSYPTTAEGLQALITPPPDAGDRWRGPYLEDKTIPLDPWQHPYQYRCPGVKNPDKYDLWSLGPDGKESDDDIGNWK